MEQQVTHLNEIKMKHGSLFNGIGGFQLAAAWMGWENVFSCEIDEFCNKVTKHHFPNCIQHGDIKTTDFTIYRGAIDVLTGGFPCQPFSAAGQRKGTEDNRHLWPENLRVVKEIKPKIIVGENVYGILTWERGLVFEMVCADLENEGYEVQPIVLPACSQNTNHRRDRVWFVARLNGCSEESSGKGGQPISFGSENYEPQLWRGQTEQRNRCNTFLFNTANPECVGRKELELQSEQAKREVRGSIVEAWNSHWIEWPIEPTICGNDDGVPNRVDRVTALGNAIVPQVAYQIFKAIQNTI